MDHTLNQEEFERAASYIILAARAVLVEHQPHSQIANKIGLEENVVYTAADCVYGVHNSLCEEPIQITAILPIPLAQEARKMGEQFNRKLNNGVHK